MTSDQANAMCNQILDKYGYNTRMTQKRIEVNSKISQSITINTHRNLGNTNIDKVLVGSRREGISLFGESDSDVMFVFKDLLVTEAHHVNNIAPDSAETLSEVYSITFKSQFEPQTIFHMDQRDVPDGYTLLRVCSANTNEYTRHAVNITQNGTFLSGSLFLTSNKYKFRLYKGWMKSAVQYLRQNGPSLPEMASSDDMYLKSLNFVTGQNYIKYHKDCVFAIPCHCPSLLDEWKNRTRFSDWPTQNLIQQVVKLPVHVVPVGLKGSINEDLQWRISFTFAEIHLVQTFNDTRIKLLVLLRLIAKEILKPISSTISSYVIKNLVFWLSETVLSARSTNSTNLVDQVKSGLLQLQGYIGRKDLPCYMTPGRNLLLPMKDSEAKDLVSALDSFIYSDNQQFALFIIKTMKKNNIEKLARLDRVGLEIYKDITPMEIGEITFISSKCTTSYGQHLSNAYLLLVPYIKKNGIKQLVRCACLVDEDDHEQSSENLNEHDANEQSSEHGNEHNDHEESPENGNEHDDHEQSLEIGNEHSKRKHNSENWTEYIDPNLSIENGNKHNDHEQNPSVQECSGMQYSETDSETITVTQTIIGTVQNIFEIAVSKLQYAKTMVTPKLAYSSLLSLVIILYLFDPCIREVLAYIIPILAFCNMLTFLTLAVLNMFINFINPEVFTISSSIVIVILLYLFDPCILEIVMIIAFCNMLTLLSVLFTENIFSLPISPVLYIVSSLIIIKRIIFNVYALCPNDIYVSLHFFNITYVFGMNIFKIIHISTYLVIFTHPLTGLNYCSGGLFKIIIHILFPLVYMIVCKKQQQEAESYSM